MRKLILLFVITLFSVSQVFAFALKVYDEYGNRVGTYRKEGDSYQFYDFNDNRVDNPEDLIKNAPSQKTLTEYSQTFYDENMIPIGTWKSGLYGNNGRYYPRFGENYPTGWYRTRSPYIVRPSNRGIYKNPNSGMEDRVNFVDTRYPRFHEFK